MSEKRDLWVPAVLALGGIGLLIWHLVHEDGSVFLGAGACLMGITGAIACLVLRIRKGQARVVTFGAGAALLLVIFLPGEQLGMRHIVPLAVGALAFLVPIKAAPLQTRGVMLIGAALFALLAALSAMEVIPRSLVWLFVSGAFFLAVQVFNSRIRPKKPPPPGQRVCIFGGSFDPFHRGHRAMAEAALRVNDRLLVVVAGAAPHKFADEEGAAPEGTPFHHRVAMTRLGIEGLPRTEVLELEGRRSGPSYTVDTLDVLVRSYPAGTRFRILLGADMFQDFPNWRDWRHILGRATLLVARRPGHELDPPPELDGEDAPVLGLDAPEIDIAASDIRKTLAGGEDPGDVMAVSIRNYITDHGLYAAPAPKES